MTIQNMAGFGPMSPEVGRQVATPGPQPARSKSIRQGPENESEFRIRLGHLLRLFGHGVYFHDPDDPKEFEQFHVRKVRVYPDLYIKTSPDWEHNDIFPTIAIETKLSKGLNWTARHALKQITKYNAASDAVYEIDGEEVPKPSIILLATPTSVSDPGVLYIWRHPYYDTQDKLWAASHAITELLQRQLQDVGAAVMVGGGFTSNIIDPEGGKGPMRTYALEVASGRSILAG